MFNNFKTRFSQLFFTFYDTCDIHYEKYIMRYLCLYIYMHITMLAKLDVFVLWYIDRNIDTFVDR